MPRRLNTVEQNTMSTVYETLANMLAEDNNVWLPALIEGLDMQDEPEVIWQALRDLMSRGLLDMRFVQPSDKVTPNPDCDKINKLEPEIDSGL
jgi:hypothetical protein